MKYPRTYHLPWSEGFTSDDKVLSNDNCFLGRNVVVTEKRDGENTTMRCDRVHARSLDSCDHVSRHWVKRLWSSIKHLIPEGYRICGENMFARHSISYNELDSYFEVFNIWNNNICLSWADTIEWCELLGLVHVPVIYSGLYGADEMWVEVTRHLSGNVEGYVVRLADSFSYECFGDSVAKWVRANHVNTDSHWMFQTVVANGLRGDV